MADTPTPAYSLRLRVRMENRPGMLGQLAMAIGEVGANIAALDGFDPTRFWSAEDVAHYEQAFSDPGAWFHAVEYYRHALPFHVR